MKKNFGLSLVLFVVTMSPVDAQDNHGYYGKKTYIDISMSPNIPFFYNLAPVIFGEYNTGYKVSSSGNSLVEANDWFNLGARFSIGRTVKSNMGISLELGYDKFTITNRVLNSAQSQSAFFYVDRHENIKVNSFLIMPKLEFIRKNGLHPNGLVHQLGIGMSLNKVVEKNYLIQTNNTYYGGPNGTIEDQNNLYKNFPDLLDWYRSVQVMYGLKMRTPINKSLMFNYGVEANIALPFRTIIDFIGFSSNNSTNIAGEIEFYKLTHILSLDLGLTFVF